MPGGNHSLPFSAEIFHALGAVVLAAAICGCSETNIPVFESLPVPGCLAFNCHPAGPLSIYPPASGEHRTHLGLAEYGTKLSCGSCHRGYSVNILHRNGIINGYNWLVSSKMPGMVVYFSADLSGAAFDTAGSTCSGTGTGCHDSGASNNWYGGAGGTCGDSSSCHLAAPLSQYPPATGAHAIHRYKQYNCSACHYDYFGNALHRNTFVNGSALDPKATVTASVVFFNTGAISSPPAWSNTTADCGSSSCHGARNWYSYTNDSRCPVCHAYPPLLQSYPTSGRHFKHRDEGYGCSACHTNYAAGGYPNHNNGVINGTSFDPKATAPGTTVYFSGPGSYNTSTGTCSSVGCHGTENWWTGGD